MLKRGIAHLGALALLLLFASCGGESASSSGGSGERLLPTPTVPTATPIPEPTATPPAPGAGGGTFPLPTNPAQTASATTEPTETLIPTLDPSLTPTVEPVSSVEDVAIIRQMVQDYWAALNDYDVDLAIAMLESGYREAEEELIRRDIGRMKLFRAKLRVSEELPPTMNSNGDYETHVNLETPIDTRRVHMIFRRINGQWWIIYADEVE